MAGYATINKRLRLIPCCLSQLESGGKPRWSRIQLALQSVSLSRALRDGTRVVSAAQLLPLSVRSPPPETTVSHLVNIPIHFAEA